MKANPSEGDVVLEFRVAVRGIRPVIWRHVAVLGTTSLAELHRVLQVVCEWGDKHPYVFAIGGQSFGPFSDVPIKDARGVTLADLKTYGWRNVCLWLSA